jgi:hypothetical protein
LIERIERDDMRVTNDSLRRAYNDVEFMVRPLNCTLLVHCFADLLPC